uniref:ribonuclease T2 n=1 Tax=Mycena chlorophos TaxID=658473 RepID=A0ABQ0LDV9_MYCCL|nr:ribonuclease T2 [Mycena chlorophos]
MPFGHTAIVPLATFLHWPGFPVPQASTFFSRFPTGDRRARRHLSSGFSIAVLNDLFLGRTKIKASSTVALVHQNALLYPHRSPHSLRRRLGVDKPWTPLVSYRAHKCPLIRLSHERRTLLRQHFRPGASDSTGPTNSWTIHGLWGDECNGNFIEDCDSSRDYTGISTLMTQQGGSATLSLMETFWKNLPSDGTDEELWEHEWATHGTCYSTLQVDCLPAGSPKGAEAVAFFETVVKLFQTLPTYEWLADAGITPSSSKTYTLAELNDAVEGAWGFEPAFQCDGSSLDGVFYYFQLQGSVIDGTFFPRTAFTESTCPNSGIKYTPKTGTTSVAAVEIPVETGAA